MKFLLAAIVVSPFRDIAPVPVPNVPAPEIAKFPDDCVYPVDPDIAPALIFNAFIVPVVFAVMTPVLVIL